MRSWGASHPSRSRFPNPRFGCSTRTLPTTDGALTSATQSPPQIASVQRFATFVVAAAEPDDACPLGAPQRRRRQAHRRCQRVSRLIVKLRGHGLVAKSPRPPLPRHRLRATSHDRRHRHPRRPLPDQLSRSRGVDHRPVSPDTQILAGSVRSPGRWPGARTDCPLRATVARWIVSAERRRPRSADLRSRCRPPRVGPRARHRPRPLPPPMAPMTANAPAAMSGMPRSGRLPMPRTSRPAPPIARAGRWCTR